MVSREVRPGAAVVNGLPLVIAKEHAATAPAVIAEAGVPS
jgi:hypothetical protein